MASYLRALGDSTSDATAIDLDVGVSSQHLDEESLFRVQEGADGTSFVLEFTLDADDAGVAGVWNASCATSTACTLVLRPSCAGTA